MEVNNYQTLLPIIKFTDPGDFYFLQIIKRKKDNPNEVHHKSVHKDMCFYTVTDFIESEERVKAICLENNARAYLRVNKRNCRGVMINLAKWCLDNLDQPMVNFESTMAHVIGTSRSSSSKIWIVDVDNLPGCSSRIDIVRDFVDELHKEMWDGVIKVYTNYLQPMIVPTVHGFHLLTSPFNMQKFSKRFPDMDVHKDNPTILYYGDPIESPTP